MKTSDQIKIEIQDKFGFVPPFFEAAQQSPDVLENLWHQTLSAYINNPLPPVFKEKLSAYLSRYCAVPYCLVCHSCSLHALGMNGREVLHLLESPPPSLSEIDFHLSVLKAHSAPLKVLSKGRGDPAPTALQESLLRCAIFISLEQEEAEQCRDSLRCLLGSKNYEHLVTFIAYVRNCHVWMKAHPEVSYKDDKRAQDHLAALLAEEPALADFFDNYIDRINRERLEKTFYLTKNGSHLSTNPGDNMAANIETPAAAPTATKQGIPKSMAASGSATLSARQVIFRLIRLGFGLGVIAIAAALLWQKNIEVRSRQGFINAAIISIEAPIQGNLQLQNLNPGQLLEQGAVVGSIKNPRNAELETTRQQLKSQLQISKNQLASIEEKIANRQQLLGQFERESRLQESLQVVYYQQVVERYRSELKAAQHAGELANLEAKRYARIAARGALSRQLADEAAVKAKQAADAVTAKQAQLAQAETQLQAGAKGLQLDAGKTYSYPEIRRREIQSELADLQLEKSKIQTEIQANKLELATAFQQLTLQKTALIKIPSTGVVWSVDTKPGNLGTPINAGSHILQILDCENIWIESFVSERDAKNLSIGAPAEVRFLANRDNVWHGYIQAIRAGVGRVNPGEDVAVPPPERVRRELEVRVGLSEPKKLDPHQFCQVGRSVEVSFPK